MRCNAAPQSVRGRRREWLAVGRVVHDALVVTGAAFWLWVALAGLLRLTGGG